MPETTDPRIAVLAALSSPGWHPVPEAHGMPWDEAEQLLNAYRAAVLAEAAVVSSAPADRAAIRAKAFQEAAEKLADLDPAKAALAGESAWKTAAGIVRHMAAQERRMADEAQLTPAAPSDANARSAR